jgi:CheY-like chemotaxis protein
MNPHGLILLVEDDLIDQKSVLRAFRDLKITNPVAIAKNGQEALVYLNGAKNKLPCLILLDLRMPVMNGLEFLKEVKRDDFFKVIPVVVLTTSKEDQDLNQSFEFGAAGYMVKPVDYKKFLGVVQTIHLYWTLSLTPPNLTDLKEAL